MKYYFTLFLLLSIQLTYAQVKKRNMPRDKVVLNSGEVVTGKVIQSDSVKIILRKYDYSQSELLWKSIDTITGLSYKTLFVSPFIGLGGINYWSTFRYDKVHSSGMGFGVKIGKMRRKHSASFLQLTLMPYKPYSIFKMGLGFNYYLPNDYTKNVTSYIGGRFDMNSVTLNTNPFFSFGLQAGIEYNTKRNNRFFMELSNQRTVFNIHKGNGLQFNMGIRFSKEYKQFYKRLNTRKSL